MTLLIRKIEKGKWMQNDILNGADVSADAITSCLKTRNNSLSVWEIETDLQLDDATLAIVSASDYLETIDIVLMEGSYIQSEEVEFVKSDGLTPVKDLVQNHRDLSNLTLKKLGIIAYHIADNIKKQRIKRYTLAQLKEILKNAIQSGRLTRDDLKESIKKHVN